MERTPTGALFFLRDRFVAVLIQQPYVMDCSGVSISRARVADDVGLRPRAAEVSWRSKSAVISGIPAAARQLVTLGQPFQLSQRSQAIGSLLELKFKQRQKGEPRRKARGDSVAQEYPPGRRMYQVVWERDGEGVATHALHAADEADARSSAEAFPAKHPARDFDRAGTTLWVRVIIFDRRRQVEDDLHATASMALRPQSLRPRKTNDTINRHAVIISDAYSE
jgi:hypothetical protein